MPLEIERKFLVQGDAWRRDADGRPVPAALIRQGYLFFDGLRNARVRLSRGEGHSTSSVTGDLAFLTVKGMRTGIERFEFEYAIPLADAELMLDRLCNPPLIEKTRHFIVHDRLTWVVDEFAGANAGLIMAELELQSPDQAFVLPEWVLREVTDDGRYYNTYLAAHPYGDWPPSD
ncbi:MAG: CYTH domain-containing protein [Thermoflexales bacterium]